MWNSWNYVNYSNIIDISSGPSYKMLFSGFVCLSQLIHALLKIPIHNGYYNENKLYCFSHMVVRRSRTSWIICLLVVWTLQTMCLFIFTSNVKSYHLQGRHPTSDPQNNECCVLVFVKWICSHENYVSEVEFLGE